MSVIKFGRHNRVVSVNVLYYGVYQYCSNEWTPLAFKGEHEVVQSHLYFKDRTEGEAWLDQWILDNKL